MAAGAYILAPEGPDLTSREAAFFRQADPWGFILFARNCLSPDQLTRLTNDLRQAVGRDAPILIDQEGGRVQRLRAPHWREWMPPLDQVERAGAGAARSMFLRGFLIGAEHKTVGIDVNCAPSCDIAYAETHPFLKNRCYGRDADTVIAMARAVADGLGAAGVLPVMKHAPGHGRATLDSHSEMPGINVALDELRQSDFRPFKALADLPMTMTAHLFLPEIDPELPVTLSSKGVAFLRSELGLANLLMTDDISMGALSGNVAERSKAALTAGCDVVLHCNGVLDEMEDLVAEAGPMTASASARAQHAIAGRKRPDAINITEAEAELEMLLQGEVHA